MLNLLFENTHLRVFCKQHHTSTHQLKTNWTHNSEKQLGNFWFAGCKQIQLSYLSDAIIIPLRHNHHGTHRESKALRSFKTKQTAGLMMAQKMLIITFRINYDLVKRKQLTKNMQQSFYWSNTPIPAGTGVSLDASVRIRSFGAFRCLYFFLLFRNKNSSFNEFGTWSWTLW